MNCECSNLIELNGDGVIDYAREHLRIVNVGDLETEYVCPDTGIHWIMSYPYRILQGGDPPRLKRKFIPNFSEEKMNINIKCQCNDFIEMNGFKADKYANGHLRTVHIGNWVIEYECSETGIHWIMDYPHGELQGGGPPRLKRKEIFSNTNVDGEKH